MIISTNTNLDKCCSGCDEDKKSLQVGFQNGTCRYGTPAINIPLCQSLLSLPEGTDISGGTSILSLGPGEYKTLSLCDTGNIQVIQVPTGMSVYWRYKTPEIKYPCSPKSNEISYSLKLVSVTNILSDFPKVTLQLTLAHKNNEDSTIEEEIGMFDVIGKKVGKGLVKIESKIKHSYKNRIFEFNLSGLQLLYTSSSVKDKISKINGIQDYLLPEEETREYLVGYYSDIKALQREGDTEVLREIIKILGTEVPGLSELESLGKTPKLELLCLSISGDVRANVLSSTSEKITYSISSYFFEASPMVLLQGKDISYPIELYNPMDVKLPVTVFVLKIREKDKEEENKNVVAKKISHVFGTTIDYMGN